MFGGLVVFVFVDVVFGKVGGGKVVFMFGEFGCVFYGW